QMTTVDSLIIGQAHGEKVRLFVEPVAVSDFDHDGLLGPDIMHQYDIEFDFAGGKFNMFLPLHCPGNVVYWTRTAYATVPIKIGAGWHMTVTVTLDGKSVDAVIDSGSPRSMLTMEAANDLFGLDEKSPGVVSLGDLHQNHTSGMTTYR